MNKLSKVYDYHVIKKIVVLALMIIGILLISSTGFAATVEDRIEDFVYPKPKPEKTVYLTFDDGPSQYSHELMDLLEKYDVPAIFFIIGENIDLYSNSKEVLNEMIERGHYLGLHSMTHQMDTLYNVPNAPQNFVNEMLAVKQKIYDLTGGFESELCRAPYGSRNHFKAGHYAAVKDAGLNCVDWNVDSLDWSKSNADQIFNQVVAELKRSDYPKEVVLLFHEKKLTLQVLPRVIEYYRGLGYEFVAYYEGQEFECSSHQKK